MADSHPIIARKEAKALGLVRYFTGKPCPKGHIAERFTKYGQCLDCVTASRDEWHEANKERARARNIKWHLDNPDAKRARDAKWRAKNKDVFRASIKRHYLANPEMYASYRANRRARLKAAPGNGITADDIKRLTKLQGGKCAYCKKQKPLTLDHIEPLARGGAHEAKNAQMVCKSCNSSKCAKDPLDFARLIGLLL
jgi:5-methylcytosine-specific restriction endonuclease McrA